MKSQKLGHVEKVRFEKSKALVLVKCAHESGMDLFVYLKMERKGYEQLLDAYETSEIVKFSDYGEVLMFGKGEPNDETRQFMASIEL
jgi:hypothetical protein